LSTLHAENIEYAIRRLVSPPMNVSETYIPLINAVILVERVSLPSPRAGMSIGRRARMTWEVEDFEKYSNVFSWVPQDDIFLSRAKDSTILMRLAERLGKSRRWVINELERRKIVIHWMADKGIRNVKDVARIVYQYYSNPDTLLSKIEEEATIKTEVIQPIFAAPAAVEPSAAPSEPETPVRFIEESLIRIYDILVSHKGSASLETLAKDSGMDDVTLWRYLNILKGFGHVQVVEKKEGDRFSTFFTLSERGSSAYETLKSRLSRK
jgi:flagellar protein FlaI